jgi:hypothetical protein
MPQTERPGRIMADETAEQPAVLDRVLIRGAPRTSGPRARSGQAAAAQDVRGRRLPPGGP